VAEKEGKNETGVNNVKFKQSGEEEMLREEIETHKNVWCGYFDSLEQKMPRSPSRMILYFELFLKLFFILKYFKIIFLF
jgi:hypothetical protein